jgi:hypothetical protein
MENHPPPLVLSPVEGLRKGFQQPARLDVEQNYFKKTIAPRRQARKEKSVLIFRTLAPFAPLREISFFVLFVSSELSNKFG